MAKLIIEYRTKDEKNCLENQTYFIFDIKTKTTTISIAPNETRKLNEIVNGIEKELQDGYHLNKDEKFNIIIEKRVEKIARDYKEEEIKQINLMFNKEHKVLTKEELEFANHFDLFDEHIGIMAGLIWKHKNNPKMLNIMKKIFDDNKLNDFDKVFGGVINGNN